MKKLWLTIPLILLLVAGGLLLNKRRQEVADTPVAATMIHAVRTTLAQNRTISQTSSFLAELQAAKSAAISSKLSGQIIQLAVHENQQVETGQLLVQIDDREMLASIRALQARLVAAQQQLKYSQAQYQRNLALYQAGGLALEKLEAAEVNSSSAMATVQELRENLKNLNSQHEYLQIRAPFAGIIGNILLRQGDLATPGRTILKLNSLPQKLIFRFASGASSIQVGQPVLSRGREIGVVSRLYDEADRGLSVAEITPEQRLDLPSGSYLTIKVVTATASGCALPLQSLLHRTQGVSVMLYREDHFTEQPVTATLQSSDLVLVTPCPSSPVAVAAEAKLSLLPGYGKVKIIEGAADE